MYEMIHGLGNILCVLAIAGLPIGLIKPALLKQETRIEVIKVLSILFLSGFCLVAVGAYYGGMLG